MQFHSSGQSTAFIAAAAQVAVGQDLFALQDALGTASNQLPRAMLVARGELRACCLLFALQPDRAPILFILVKFP